MEHRSLWRDPATRQLVVLSALGFNSFFLTLASLATWAVRGGASNSSAGAVTGVMLASTVLVQAVVPAMERRWSLLPILTCGLIALGAPAPLYAVSQNLGWLIGLSAVRGAGFAVLTVVGGLLTTRIAPPERHGEVVGAYGLSIALPNLAAIPAGVALTLSGHFVWVAVLAASPLLALPAVRSLSRIARLDEAYFSARSPTRSRRTPSSQAVQATLKPALVLGAMTTSGGGLVTFLPIERPTGAWASVALFGFGLAAALSRWGAATLSGWYGARLLPAALGLGVAGFTIVAATLDHRSVGLSVVLLGGATIFGVGYGLAQNLTLVAAFARADEADAIIASTVWNIAFDAGTAVGAYGVGVLAAGLGLPGAYLLCALLLAATLPLTRPSRVPQR
jgi:predicted MFS family arabinose efflux permease